VEAISVFDMFKIGIGPSSSHTLGPWRAAQRWLRELPGRTDVGRVERLQIDLYGSLALTGRGHATDRALALALLGHDPETFPVERIEEEVARLATVKRVALPGGGSAAFDLAHDVAYHGDERLPGHANGMRFRAIARERSIEDVFYSIGGGFVVREGEDPAQRLDGRAPPLFPVGSGADLLRHCRAERCRVADVVRTNERAWRDSAAIDAGLRRIWLAMRDCAYRGCHAEGELPGGLRVQRRAALLTRRMLAGAAYDDPVAWMEAVGRSRHGFVDVLQWVCCFALAVNEENAAMGRVVTAPTNGAAGVVPAVLLYYVCFSETPVPEAAIGDFLLTASEIGAIFKRGATLSAAMGGCQAEIGVSSAMAAAGLTEAMGGSPEQALMAAEIAMEHHLGMTCDPIAGLVQVPCIERNAMGAIKAITAARLALEGDPTLARVTLDDVVRTMWDTARDMHDHYKETSQGGLAVNVSVDVSEC
jgi:L-serine dehydratase